MKFDRLGYTHTCIRTLAFTTPCTSDGFTDSDTILVRLKERVAGLEFSDETQEACGPEVLDIEPNE